MQKLFKCGNYSREETIWGKTVTDFEGQPLYTYLLIILIRAFISTEEARLWFFKDFTIKLCYSFFVIWSLAARESNIHICFFSHKNNLVDFLNLFHLFHYKQQAIKYCMSLNLDWDYIFGNIIVIDGFWNISTSSNLCCHFLLLPTSIQYPKITNYLSKMPLLCLFWNIIVIIVGFWNTRTSSSSLWCHFLLLTVATTNQLRPWYFVKVPIIEAI